MQETTFLEAIGARGFDLNNKEMSIVSKIEGKRTTNTVLYLIVN